MAKKGRISATNNPRNQTSEYNNTHNKEAVKSQVDVVEKKQVEESVKVFELKTIYEPLHEHYANKAEIFLANQAAYQMAEKLKDVPSSQLRKILNQSKAALNEVNNLNPNLNDAKNMLFALLPLAAYNAGRDKKNEVLYDFLRKHITAQTIIDERDIKCFDELFTSIVAYRKFMEKEGK